MSKANAFAALMKEAKGHGVAETEKQQRIGRGHLEKRPRGKREDADYGKIGVYIRHHTIAEVKARLIRDRKDLSDLIQQLLDQWLSQAH